MKWNPQDIEKFVQTKEYVDTVVLPLLPVSFENKMKHNATMSEFIHILTMQLEKQLKGRILLLPGLIYLKKDTVKDHLHQLNEWEQQILTNRFRHLFYVTSDSDWNCVENDLLGKLIWLPSLPIDQMDEQHKTTLIEDQVNQLLQLFFQKWREID